MLQRFDEESMAWLAAVVRDHRSAALASLGPGGSPSVSLVSYADTRDLSAFWLHVSDLSAHTAHLRHDPRCGLMIAAPDDGESEPLQKHRLMLDCWADVLEHDDPEYPAAKARYLYKLPQHEMMFGLGDFHLVRLTPSGGLFNAGFGKAYRVTPSILGRAGKA